MKIRWNGTCPHGGSSCATFHSSLTHNTCIHRPGQRHSWRHGQFAPYCSGFVASCTAKIILGYLTSHPAFGHCSEAQRIFRRTRRRSDLSASSLVATDSHDTFADGLESMISVFFLWKCPVPPYCRVNKTVKKNKQFFFSQLQPFFKLDLIRKEGWRKSLERPSS